MWSIKMNLIQLVSILLELVVAVIGVMLAVYKKKRYGWFIALTFVLYVFYDLAYFLSLQISQDLLYYLFFVATLSILWAIWNIFLEA
jgi:hypothetical protein